MQHEIENGTESGVESTLQKFIETDLNSELQSLRLSFRQPLREWFTGTRDAIQRLKKDDELYYKQTVDLLNDKLPELREIIEEMKSDNWHSKFAEAMVNVTYSLPEEMKEEQVEYHLEAATDDSIRVKAGKFLKRMKQSVSRNPLTRTVYMRQLFLKHVSDSESWVQDIAAREYDELAMLLDLLLEKSEKEENDKKEEGKDEKKSKHTEGEEKKENKNGGKDKNTDKEKNDDYKKKGKEDKTEATDFKFKIFSKLEDHLQVGVQYLKQVEQHNEEQVTQYLSDFSGDLLAKSRIAGTFQFPQNKQPVGPNRVLDRLSGERFEKQRTEWLRFLMSQFSDLKVQIEIARYGFLASSAKDEIMGYTHEFFRDTFYLPIEKGVEATKETVKKIGELKSTKGVGKKLEEMRLELKEKLEANLLEPMRDIERLMEPVRNIQNVLSDLQAESRRFSDEVTLAEKRESNYPVPFVELDTIRWQSLAARFLKEEAVRKLDPTLQQFDQLVSELITDTEESAQVVDVNMLAAIESTQTEKQEGEDSAELMPISIALEGLERAISTLEKGIKNVREKHNVYEEILKKRLPTALHSLAGTMLRREFDQFEIMDKALLVKEKALNWRERVSSRLAVGMEKLEAVWRLAVKKFRKGRSFVSRYLGFSREDAISTKEKRNLAEYLARPGSSSDLPFVYKRLFDRDFSIDERFYITPNNSISFIQGAYDHWKRGLSANVAVIGEKGSGKSTLIRFAEKECLNGEETFEVRFDDTFTEEQVLLKYLCSTLGFKPVETRQEFLEKVARKKQRSVVVVENLQNIFIRNINGYEALEAFWIIMSSTMDKLFWIVSCSRYTWQFFVKMSNADQYFTHVTETDRLDEPEIREAILSRHKSSGYELYFEPGESLKNSRTYKKLVADEKKTQELVRDNFFSKLYKICEGNTSIAMIFWLQSIKEFDSQRFVFQPIEITELDKLEVPSKEVLFTLAALVQHDSLKKEQVALALHQNPSDSSLMLARLKTKGIVYEGKTGYNLNHLVYRQVVRMLKQRNIIH